MTFIDNKVSLKDQGHARKRKGEEAAQMRLRHEGDLLKKAERLARQLDPAIVLNRSKRGAFRTAFYTVAADLVDTPAFVQAFPKDRLNDLLGMDAFGGIHAPEQSIAGHKPPQ